MDILSNYAEWSKNMEEERQYSRFVWKYTRLSQYLNSSIWMLYVVLLASFDVGRILVFFIFFQSKWIKKLYEYHYDYKYLICKK